MCSIRIFAKSRVIPIMNPLSQFMIIMCIVHITNCLYTTVELSNEVIKCLIDDVMWLLMAWSNQNVVLSQECIRSSALLLPTAYLHTARALNRFDHVCII